jgi:hypothetical protein
MRHGGSTLRNVSLEEIGIDDLDFSVMLALPKSTACVLDFSHATLF